MRAPLLPTMGPPYQRTLLTSTFEQSEGRRNKRSSFQLSSSFTKTPSVHKKPYMEKQNYPKDLLFLNSCSSVHEFVCFWEAAVPSTNNPARPQQNKVIREMMLTHAGNSFVTFLLFEVSEVLLMHWPSRSLFSHQGAVTRFYSKVSAIKEKQRENVSGQSCAVQMEIEARRRIYLLWFNGFHWYTLHWLKCV